MVQPLIKSSCFHITITNSNLTRQYAMLCVSACLDQRKCQVLSYITRLKYRNYRPFPTYFTYGYGSAATLLLDCLIAGVRTYIFLALSAVEIFANNLLFQWALLASTFCLESVTRKVQSQINPPRKSTSAACSS